VLAALLWATEFKGKDAELLFRCVAALTQRRWPPKTERAKPVEENGDSKSLRSKYRTAVRDRERAVQTSNKLAHDLQQRDRALEHARRDLEDIQAKYSHTTREIDRLQHLLRHTELAYRDSKRDGERVTNAASALRRDLWEQQKTMDEVEAARAGLALQLAADQRTIQHLKLELATVPRGSDAVNSFLREEARGQGFIEEEGLSWLFIDGEEQLLLAHFRDFIIPVATPVENCCQGSVDVLRGLPPIDATTYRSYECLMSHV
jgi:hypothetical protein